MTDEARNGCVGVQLPHGGDSPDENPDIHNYQQILNDCQQFSQSHGPGCASQDPEASVGGPFAILSDLGPSKGTEAGMVGKTW